MIKKDNKMYSHVFFFVSIFLIAGCQSTPKAAPPASSPETTAKVSKVEAQPSQKVTESKSETVQSNKKEVAVIETNKGTIVFKFYPVDAPKTVENFKKLVNGKFYDNLTWHRVVKGFVIQGGDPHGDGSGGPGYTIEDEFNARPHLEGTVAMARTPLPHSAGSQFYICLAPQPNLDGKYTVFGQTIEGFDVVQNIVVGDKIMNIRIEEREMSK